MFMLHFLLNLLPFKVVSTETTPDKKALKLVRLQERGLNVLTTTDQYVIMIFICVYCMQSWNTVL